MITTIRSLYTRDLEKLATEIAAYNDVKNLWITDGKITNSAGNLCLHIVGNLNTFIGHGIGKTGYIRHRDGEFGDKDIPRAQMISDIHELKGIVDRALSNLTEADLTKKFPIKIWKNQTGMMYTLMHLHSHLNYHLGQINYHRRLLDQ